ncbi:MAG: substrate-binding domain-containing protein [Chloroflexi bacterium]|nr:substrate-binding domain-containing protein [Chloroflexota bacterium]
MKKYKHHVGVIAVLLILCCLVMSCAPKPVSQPEPTAPAVSTSPAAAPSQAGPKFRVGVSLLNRQHDFYKDLEEGMNQAAGPAGVELIIRDADFKLADQVSDIEDFIVQKVDALIICPVDTKGVGVAIKNANNAGIPVFTADIASEEGKVECHVASNNIEGGRKAAAYLGKLLKGKGKVLIVDWPYATSVLDRVKGFEEGMKAFPEIKILEKIDGGAQRDTAMKVMENMLQAHQDIAGVFAINDDTALGCLSAVEAANRNNIAIIGYDAIPEARAAILRDSPLKADVAQFPKEIGKDVVDVTVKFLNKEKIPGMIPVQVDIIDKAYLEKLAGAEGKK